jgi:AraC-like DNA-binding protein
MKRKPTNVTNIKKADLSLLDFLKQSNTVPGKIVLFENIEGLDTSGYFYLQGLVLFLIEKGHSTIEVNTTTYDLEKGCIFVAFPGQIIHVISISDDIKPLCIACSMDMMNDLMSQVKDSLQLFQHAKQSPFQKRDGEDFEQIKKSFRHIQEKIKVTKDNRYHYQIIKNLVISTAFECLDILTEKCIEPQGSNRKKALFNAFLQKVEEEHRENHSVKHYADELFVTPKYLSTVVEEMSGKSAKQWINEYIALDAKVLLQSTQKDIQEISNDLNFIDVSFFGKFFKRMTGMTPKAFREKKE